MTLRQNILRIFYPLFSAFRKSISAKHIFNTGKIIPPVPFHSLSVDLINGGRLRMEDLRGKKILIVNTASDCGFTSQYAELQKVYVQFPGTLEIIGFPSNDFKQQEKGTDEQIENFCKKNFGVTFPLVKKSVVVKIPEQNKIYKWLTSKENNGWNDQAPTWNFSKYLVDENGILTRYFDPSLSPLGKEICEAIKDKY
jgi:glutathione peroxidase